MLEARLEDRNRLAHRFFYERAEDMVSREGRDALIYQFHTMAQQFLDANKVLRQVMFAWIKARGAPEAEVEQTLRGMREERGLPPDLPPHLE